MNDARPPFVNPPEGTLPSDPEEGHRHPGWPKHTHADQPVPAPDRREGLREARYEGRIEALDAILTYLDESLSNDHGPDGNDALDAVNDKVRDLRSRATAARSVDLAALAEEPPARTRQLSTKAGYEAWKASAEPPCTECGGGKGLGHTPDCPAVAGDRDAEDADDIADSDGRLAPRGLR